MERLAVILGTLGLGLLLGSNTYALAIVGLLVLAADACIIRRYAHGPF